LLEEMESLMVDAFRLRTIADVPVGVFLSGGVDSSVVTALLQRHVGSVHTFTMGFADQAYDESSQARAVANHLGTIHREATMSGAEGISIFLRWPELYDEPFADSSGIPTHAIAVLASESV
jgi:asparagine synthase (glutamine-hydrolysing)